MDNPFNAPGSDATASDISTAGNGTDLPAAAPATDGAASAAAQADAPPPPHRVVFHGRGDDFFGIYAVNLFLTLLSLGFYRPWARAKSLKYLFSQTEFAGSRFTFHGTGKEMFQGYIRGLLLLGLIVGWQLFMRFLAESQGRWWLAIVGTLGFYVGLGFLIPVAMYGMLRYRLSRTSWRGIHGGYRGDLMDLVGNYIGSYLLTIITLGVYYPWLVNNLRDGIVNNIRIGNVRLRYNGKGSDIFGIYVKYIGISYGLVIIALIIMAGSLVALFQNADSQVAQVFLFAQLIFLFIAIYGLIGIFRERELLLYLAKHSFVQQGEELHPVSLSLPLWPYAKLMVGNVLLTVITLGIYIPWAKVRYLKFVTNGLTIPGAVNLEAIAQTEDQFKDATGDDLTSLLDISWA
jgi:uncharacterized membrane protein YjgN (DUF898 family)